MRILKKSLACLLVAIIAMTAMFGCLVSAEEAITGTICVAGATVYDTTVDTIDVDVYVDAQAPISVARVKVNVPAKLGTITSATVSGEGVKAFEEDVEKDYNLATGTFLVAANDWSIGFTSAIITLTITLADNIAAGAYEIVAENITEVEGADWSENPCRFEITNGDVVVPYVLALDGDNLAITLAAGETATVMGTVNSAVSVVEATGAYSIGYGRQPINGDFMLSPWGGNTFTVTNNAEEAITVTLKNYSLPTKGTMDDPEIITENKDYTANVALNHVNDNYIYSFTAAEAGTVTVTMKSDTWFYTIYNENTYVQTDDQHYAFEGVASTTVDVAAGDVLSIKVNTGTYAPGEVNWNFAFEEAATDPVYNKNLKASNTSAIFESDYTLVYVIRQDRVESVENFYMEVKKDIYDGDTKLDQPKIDILTMDDMIKDENGDYVMLKNGSNYYYQLQYKGIAAKEIASGLTATIYGEIDGVLNYGDVRTDNLITYASTFVNGTDKFATTMVNFLNYGASAQEYFGYNTTNLANSVLSDAQKEVVLSADPVNEFKTLIRNENRTFKFTGAAVDFEAQIAVILNMENVSYTGNISDLYVQISYNDGAVVDKVYLSDEALVSAGKYAISYGGIAAKDMRNPIQISIVDAQGNVLSHTRQYSIQSYAYDMISSNNDAADLCRAMLAFGDAMYEYKN